MSKYVANLSDDTIIGFERIGRHMGVCGSTIRRWRRLHGFPVGILPDGRYMTTKNLVEQWLIARMSAKGSGNNAPGAPRKLPVSQVEQCQDKPRQVA